MDDDRHAALKQDVSAARPREVPFLFATFSLGMQRKSRRHLTKSNLPTDPSSEIFHGRIEDTFTPVIEAKLKTFGLQVDERRISNDSKEMTREKISASKIYNSNLYLLASRLIELGFSPKILYNLPDDAEACAEKIFSLRNEIDLLITTGGVSVGKKDIMHDVVKKIGERIFLRVLIKPGAPVIGWTCGKFLGVALSGNPFAAYATFELLARPVLAKLSRRAEILYSRSRAVLTNDFPKKSFGRRFIRAKFDGEKIFLPSRHESGSLYSAVECNVLVDIPAGSNELKTGAEVEIILL